MTEEAWRVIAPLLPASGRGGQWRDHRTVINGILWKLRTGAPWRDLPERYGPWQTCADRLYRWRRDGTWDRILAHVQTKSDAVGELVWEVSIDSTTARAHQHASGARRRPSQTDEKRGVQHPADEGLGRSRGGLTTKFHLACDGKGRPLSVVITPGQRHDSTQLGPVLDGIRVPRPGGRGRPRTRPDRVTADKGYSYPRCRWLLRQRHISHTIPERSDQRTRRASRPGRPLAFDAATYARRNVVERCINRLKQWRGNALREARGQLPGAGGHRLHRHLAPVVIRQTAPRERPIRARAWRRYTHAVVRRRRRLEEVDTHPHLCYIGDTAQTQTQESPRNPWHPNEAR